MTNLMKISAVALMALSAAPAFAKGHNQAGEFADDTPGGEDARTFTACLAQTEGEGQGNRPSDRGPQGGPGDQCEDSGDE